MVSAQVMPEMHSLNGLSRPFSPEANQTAYQWRLRFQATAPSKKKYQPKNGNQSIHRFPFCISRLTDFILAFVSEAG